MSPFRRLESARANPAHSEAPRAPKALLLPLTAKSRNEPIIAPNLNKIKGRTPAKMGLIVCAPGSG